MKSRVARSGHAINTSRFDAGIPATNGLTPRRRSMGKPALPK
jgi:hypothetical protein